MSMTFEQVVTELRKYHETVWFRCDTVYDESSDIQPYLWKGADIVSASGSILASQIGHCCEWELTPVHSRLACIWNENENENDMDGNIRITQEFVEQFRFVHLLGLAVPH